MLRIQYCLTGWWGVIAALFTMHAGAAMLTRGPYLQNATTRSVVIRWRTDIPTESHLRFGVSLSDLNRAVFDTSLATNHEVIVAELRPNTRYYYAIGSETETFAAGPEYFFSTNPDTARPTRIWVLGDAGTRSNFQRAVRDAYYAFSTNRHTDLWLMLGDNAYESGTDEQYQAALFDMYPEILRQSVLWPALGNHDTYSAGKIEQFPYLEIFTLPTEGEAGGISSGTEKYYSFDYGNIHFVVLDSMSSNRETNGAMCAWLENNLAANTNEWTIALWHHPPYTRGSHDSDSELELVEMRQFIVPILEAHGVDLILCGHSHSYERSHLLRGHYGHSSTLVSGMIMDHRGGPYRVDDNERDGAIYVVAGSSGQISGGALNHPAMYVSLNELGSLVLDINGGRLDAIFLQSEGSIGDAFTLVKPGVRQPLRITSFNIDSGLMNIEWTANAGETYHVERTLTLPSPEWQRIGPPVTALGDIALWAWPVDAEPHSFFRVVAF